MRNIFFSVISLFWGALILIGVPMAKAEDSRYGWLPGHVVALSLGGFLFGAGIYFLVVEILKTRTQAKTTHQPNNDP
jgi:hypothetical protein